MSGCEARSNEDLGPHMKMEILIFEAVLFAACFLWHVLLWHRNIPRNHGLALTAIFLIPWLSFAVLAVCFSGSAAFRADIFSLAILHLSLSLAYIFTYPALEGVSPSLAILILIEKSRTGLTEEEIARQFDEAVLWDKKLCDLLSSGLVARTGDRLAITAKGKFFTAPFILLRRLLGLPMGRG